MLRAVRDWSPIGIFAGDGPRVLADEGAEVGVTGTPLRRQVGVDVVLAKSPAQICECGRDHTGIICSVVRPASAFAA